MKTSSNKAKGRNGQQEIQKLILNIFPELEADDVRSTSMGATGEDLLLSPAARKLIPYNPEVKFRKKISFCRWMEQADGHGKHNPVCFFRENHKTWFACIEAKKFLELLRIVSLLNHE